jgi:hypothetical protein
VLDAPYHRMVGDVLYSTEIIWRDGDLEYALSDNASGGFNEINLGDRSMSTNGFPAFLGQLRLDDSADVSLITPFAGEHTLTRQYAGPAVAWTSMTIAANGAISFNGGAGRNIALADIASVIDRLDCCGRVDIGVNADLNGNGEIESTDGLSLYVNGAGGLSMVEYRDGSGAQNDLVGARFDSAALPEHDGTDLPTTSSMAASAVIDGGATVALDIPIHPSSSGSVTFNRLDLTADVVDGIVLQERIAIRLELGTEPLLEGESYDCHERENDGRVTRMVIRTAPVFTSDYSSENGGNCRITLTTVNATDETNPVYTLIEGTFTAELLPNKRSNPKVTIDDGVFRWVPPAP